ncbi:hypothetical protein niasHT_017334 [Heterodera trifolii]|uniref:J domain-containing protein n=1 Tax=Heterodera trifolii TaxID=157864 RepID=A0ABD2L4E2_9BILA
MVISTLFVATTMSPQGQLDEMQKIVKIPEQNKKRSEQLVMLCQILKCPPEQEKWERFLKFELLKFHPDKYGNDEKMVKLAKQAFQAKASTRLNRSFSQSATSFQRTAYESAINEHNSSNYNHRKSVDATSSSSYFSQTDMNAKKSYQRSNSAIPTNQNINRMFTTDELMTPSRKSVDRTHSQTLQPTTPARTASTLNRAPSFRSTFDSTDQQDNHRKSSASRPFTSDNSVQFQAEEIENFHRMFKTTDELMTPSRKSVDRGHYHSQKSRPTTPSRSTDSSHYSSHTSRPTTSARSNYETGSSSFSYAANPNKANYEAGSSSFSYAANPNKATTSSSRANLKRSQSTRPNQSNNNNFSNERANAAPLNTESANIALQNLQTVLVPQNYGTKKYANAMETIKNSVNKLRSDQKIILLEEFELMEQEIKFAKEVFMKAELRTYFSEIQKLAASKNVDAMENEITPPKASIRHNGSTTSTTLPVVVVVVVVVAHLLALSNKSISALLPH